MESSGVGCFGSISTETYGFRMFSRWATKVFQLIDSLACPSEDSKTTCSTDDVPLRYARSRLAERIDSSTVFLRSIFWPGISAPEIETSLNPARFSLFSTLARPVSFLLTRNVKAVLVTLMKKSNEFSAKASCKASMNSWDSPKINSVSPVVGFRFIRSLCANFLQAFSSHGWRSWTKTGCKHLHSLKTLCKFRTNLSSVATNVFIYFSIAPALSPWIWKTRFSPRFSSLPNPRSAGRAPLLWSVRGLAGMLR